MEERGRGGARPGAPRLRWLIAAAFSLATHASVFAAMGRVSIGPVTTREVVPVRLGEPPPEEEPQATPPSLEPKPEPKMRRRELARPSEPTRAPEEVSPPPPDPRPEAKSGAPSPESEGAMPGPAESGQGTGPAAGNGAMLGDGNAAAVAHTAEAGGADVDGAAAKAARARSGLKAYHRGVHAQVNQGRRYPPAAVRLGLEGKAVVRVRIDRFGRIVGKPMLMRSTSHAILDEEALAMVERVAPFPPLPADHEGQDVELEIPINFSLRD